MLKYVFEIIKVFWRISKFVLFFFKNKETGEKFIELRELRDALKIVGINIPGCDVRFLEEQFRKNDINHDGKLSIEEFSKVLIFSQILSK